MEEKTNMVNIFDTANELAHQMVETDEYKELKAAVEALKADEIAVKLFREFQSSQAAAQQKAAQGTELSEDEMNKIQEMAKQVSAQPSIVKLMEKEQRMNQMIQQIDQNVTSPIRGLYADLFEAPADK